MTPRSQTKIHFRPVSAALIALAMSVPVAAAQGLDADGAVETIIGSDVDKAETGAADQQARIVRAIENSGENAQRVRKLFNAEKVHIVLLADQEGASPQIDAATEKYADQIDALRQEIEASAILFHAIDSEDVMLRDVLGVEITGDDEVTVFAAGDRAAK